MSAIAGVLLSMGHRVSGSDIKESRHTNHLIKQGATVYFGHRPENLEDSEIVVYSSAIAEHNVEYRQAQELGLKIKKRAEMLSEVADKKSLIAVAGTHGKTTTSSMISTMMQESNEDPTYLIGAELNEIGSNSRYGEGRYCVAEADESDGSLLYLKPEIAVITNVEKDHLEFYGDLSKIESIFLQFINENLSEQGFAVVCGDYPNLTELINSFNRRFISYGMEPHNDLVAQEVKLGDFSSRFKVIYKGDYLGEVFLQVPGTHNIYNALASVCVGLIAQISFSQVAKGLGAFRGVKRRFEILGSVEGITVVDDYAHHPSEIEATLNAAKNGGWKRVISVFQPHRYSRTKFLAQDFNNCFDMADVVILTDVYGAGEEPIPGVTGKIIVNEVIRNNPGKHTIYLPRREDILNYVLPLLREGDLLLVMGAGDIFNIGQEIVLDLEKNLLKKGAVRY